MFRLLTYGGTSFAERCRYGSWAVPEGALADYYGLAGGEISFGLGLESGSAALIFRQRQSVENRGGYPYTLLFDPGATVWTAFGWSAADLLAALRADDLGLALLAGQDVVSESDAARLVARLASAQCSPAKGVSRADLFATALAGSTALGEPLGVSISQVGFDSRPDSQTIARAAEGAALPAFCRTGNGWLIGGSLAHLSPFGVQLVVDDQLASPLDRLDACLQAGGRLITGWQAVGDEFPDALKTFHTTPPWLWKVPANEVFAQVAVAASLLGGSADETTYGEARRITAHEGLLTTEIRKLARSSRSSRAGGPHWAMYRLDECWAARWELSSEELAGIDQAWLGQELRRRGVPPAAPPPGLHLDPVLHQRLWVQAIGEAPPTERIEWLGTAAGQLGSILDPRALIDAAVPDEPALPEQAALEVFWNGPFWPAILDRLRPVQRARARQGTVAPVAYIRYAEDPDLAILYTCWRESPGAATRADRFVSMCLDQLHVASVEQTLEAAAASPFRSLLSIRAKRALAERMGSPGQSMSRWHPLLVLCHLYDGAGIDVPPVSDVEKARLREELSDLLDSPSAAPNAPALSEWLAPLPAAAHARLFEAWGRTGLASRARRAAVSPGIAPRRESSGDWEPAVRETLFGRRTPEGLRELVESAEIDPVVRDVLVGILTTASHEEGRAFAASVVDPNLVVRLMNAVPAARPAVIGWLAAEKKLIDHFGQAVNAMLDPVNPVIADDVTWAVVGYLRTHPDDLNEWARQLWGNDGPRLIEILTNLQRGATT